MASKSSLLNSFAYMGNPASQLRGDAMGTSALTGGGLLARNVQPLTVADARPVDLSVDGSTQAAAPGTTSNLGTADLSGNPPTTTPDTYTPTVVTTTTPIAPPTIDLVNNTPNTPTTQPPPDAPHVVTTVPTTPTETFELGINGDPHYHLDGQTFTHVGQAGHTYQLLQTEDLTLNVLYMKTDWDISVIAAARIVTADHTIDFSLKDNTKVLIDGKLHTVDSLPGGRIDLGHGNFLTGNDGAITINVANDNGGPPAQIKLDMTDTRAGDVRITGDVDAVSGIAPYLAEDVKVGNKTYDNRLAYLQTLGGNATATLEADLNKRFDVTGTANGIPTTVFTKGL